MSHATRSLGMSQSRIIILKKLNGREREENPSRYYIPYHARCTSLFRSPFLRESITTTEKSVAHLREVISEQAERSRSAHHSKGEDHSHHIDLSLVLEVSRKLAVDPQTQLRFSRTSFST